MNERIKLLVEQAGYTKGHHDEYGRLTVMPEFNKEKFAELIVLECAEVADNADATREKWEGIGKYVREHFGVE